MNERLEKMEMALSNAGLGQNAIDKAKRLLAAGHTEDLIRYLRLCRCDLMDELHKTQRRVDCCCAANYLQLLKSDYPQLNKEKSVGLFKI